MLPVIGYTASPLAQLVSHLPEKALSSIFGLMEKTQLQIY